MNSELNWEVIQDNNLKSTIFPDATMPKHKGLFRSDTQELLSIKSNMYSPPSIAEFKDRAEEISSITGFAIEGYEELNGGRSVLGYLKSKDNKLVAGHAMEKYMVIGNSYDSRTSFFIGTSDVYVRCTNAFSQILKSMKVRNTSNSKGRRDLLMKEIEMFEQGSNEMYTMYNRFGDKIVSNDVKNEFALQVLGLDKKEELSTRDMNKLDTLHANIRSECADLGDNLWGVFNGVTYYTTHDLDAKDNGRFFGQPGTISKKAFDLCSDLVLV